MSEIEKTESEEPEFRDPSAYCIHHKLYVDYEEPPCFDYKRNPQDMVAPATCGNCAGFWTGEEKRNHMKTIQKVLVKNNILFR